MSKKEQLVKFDLSKNEVKKVISGLKSLHSKQRTFLHSLEDCLIIGVVNIFEISENIFDEKRFTFIYDKNEKMITLALKLYKDELYGDIEIKINCIKEFLEGVCLVFRNEIAKKEAIDFFPVPDYCELKEKEKLCYWIGYTVYLTER